MKRALFAAIALVLGFGNPAIAAPSPAPPSALTRASAPVSTPSWPWSFADLMALDRWVEMAPQDALPKPSTKALEAALSSDDAKKVDEAATRLALDLATQHLLGRASVKERHGWHIIDTDRDLELAPLLYASLAKKDVDAFFEAMRPASTEYSRLQSAYNSEDDPERRATIARNMERWRWMPRDLGATHVFVNAARYEATLWRDGESVRTWRVIVGKQRTPTPVFSTQIEGVILNPWWNIPASIVRESVGSLVKRNPTAARARGYVWEGGRYRQKPGPNNALGQMKLVMPNRFSVFMHDTPNKTLFNEEVRAFSHGCVRTGEAIGYATTLLNGKRSREQIDAILASRRTTRIDLADPIPLYITYFTAVSEANGAVAILDDVYGRDTRIEAPANAPRAAGAKLERLPASLTGPVLAAGSETEARPDGQMVGCSA